MTGASGRGGEHGPHDVLLAAEGWYADMLRRQHEDGERDPGPDV